MKDVLEIDKKNMFSIKAAATATGYSRDYITKLARDGKIVATQVGRQWYLDLESLTQYATIADLEQKVRNKHLSEERRNERLVAVMIDENLARREKIQSGLFRQARVSASLLLLGLVVSSFGLTGFFASQAIPLKNQAAAVAQESLTQSDFISSEEMEFSTTKEAGVSSFAADNEAILLLPVNQNQGGTLEEESLFSDSVLVETDASGQTTVRLVDAQGNVSGPGIPFVKVPVNREMP